MRWKAEAFKGVFLGSINPSLIVVNGFVRRDSQGDTEDFKKHVRTMFIGSYCAAVRCLPLGFTEEEFLSINLRVREHLRTDVDWILSSAYYTAIQLEDPPLLTEESREEVYSLHVDALLTGNADVRAIVFAIANMSTLSALFIHDMWLSEFAG